MPASKVIIVAPRRANLADSQKMKHTPKHYIYRVDHDQGFAPHVDDDICTLCGCKKSTIEVWARKGSWVIGIGGNGTGQPNRLIYAMQVEGTPLYAKFRSRYKRKSSYLKGEHIDSSARVLYSRQFYYFGDKAIDLPKSLQHIIIHGRGCKRVSDEDAVKLKDYLARKYKHYGKFGNPNNAKPYHTSGCRSRQLGPSLGFAGRQSGPRN
jgi:hypothetical protein